YAAGGDEVLGGGGDRPVRRVPRAGLVGHFVELPAGVGQLAREALAVAQQRARGGFRFGRQRDAHVRIGHHRAQLDAAEALGLQAEDEAPVLQRGRRRLAALGPGRTLRLAVLLEQRG